MVVLEVRGVMIEMKLVNHDWKGAPKEAFLILIMVEVEVEVLETNTDIIVIIIVTNRC